MCSVLFKTNISAGDYIEYKGGTESYHYDRNLNLIDIYEAIRDSPKPITAKGTGATIHYVTEENANLRMEITHILTKRVFRFNANN